MYNMRLVLPDGEDEHMTHAQEVMRDAASKYVQEQASSKHTDKELPQLKFLYEGYEVRLHQPVTWDNRVSLRSHEIEVLTVATSGTDIIHQVSLLGGYPPGTNIIHQVSLLGGGVPPQYGYHPPGDTTRGPGVPHWSMGGVSPPHWQTHKMKKITFPTLRVWAVTITIVNNGR